MDVTAKAQTDTWGFIKTKHCYLRRDTVIREKVVHRMGGNCTTYLIGVNL